MTNQGENSLVATISRTSVVKDSSRVGSKASNAASDDSNDRSSTRASFDHDEGGGVFAMGALAGGSSCSSSSASRASKEETGEDGVSEPKKVKKERKILFKGKWYSEDQIAAMERMARSLTDKIQSMEHKNHKDKWEEDNARPQDPAPATANVAQADPPKNGGFKAKASVDQSPEALAAAIYVVQGGNLTKASKSKLGSETRNVWVKISTGGMIMWGSKSSHAMRASVQRDIYDPKMSKTAFRDMDCKFAVVLEGDKFFAHSNDGGTVRAVEGRVLEFIAESPELCCRCG